MVTGSGITILLLLAWTVSGTEDVPKELIERALRVGITMEEINIMGGLELLFYVEQKEADEKSIEEALDICPLNFYDRQCSGSTTGTDNQYSPLRNFNNLYKSYNDLPIDWLGRQSNQCSPNKVSHGYQNTAYVYYDRYGLQNYFTPQQSYEDQTYYGPVDFVGYPYESQNDDPYGYHLIEQSYKHIHEHGVDSGHKSEEKLLIPSAKKNWKDLNPNSRLIIISYLDKDAMANLLELVLRNPYYRKIFVKSFPSHLDEGVSELRADFVDIIHERVRRLSKFCAYTHRKQKNTYSVVVSRLMDMLWKDNAALNFCPEFEELFVWAEQHKQHVLGESINRKKHSLTFKLDSDTFIELQQDLYRRVDYSFVRLRKEYRSGGVGSYMMQLFREILLSFSFERNFFVFSGSDFTEDSTEVRLYYKSTSSTISFVFLYPKRSGETIFIRKNTRIHFYDKVDTVVMLCETQTMLTRAEFEQKSRSFEYLNSQNFEKFYYLNSQN